MNKRGDSRLKFFNVIACLLIIVGLGAGAIYYKFYTVEEKISAFLINEGMAADTFETIPFLANLPKERNWMVGVKVKNDPKTYNYFLNEEGKIVLESISENGAEYLIMNVMN